MVSWEEVITGTEKTGSTGVGHAAGAIRFDLSLIIN